MADMDNSQSLITENLPETQELAIDTLLEEDPGIISWGLLFSTQKNIPTFKLHKQMYTFGRGNVDCQFKEDNFDRVVFSAISKLHFRIVLKKENDGESVVVLEDLSFNGTYVNKQQVGKDNRLLLQSNDEIAVAHPDAKAFVFYNCLNNDANEFPPELTQKYTICKKIGQGISGDVRLAYKVGTLERFAIKMIRKRNNAAISRSDSGGIDSTSQIANEIDLLQSVNHPCIIHLEEVIDSHDSMYLVMEFAEGGELFDRVTKHTRLLEPAAKVYMYQLCLAVEYLHKNCITHRDIKPENILLATSEELTLLKLTDFGLSKLASQTKLMSTFCGTATYWAPELLSRQPLAYSSKVDLWSLGVVIFIILSGYPPFYAETEGRLNMKIRMARFSFSNSVWNSVSESAKDLIKKLLVVDPKKRLDIEGTLKHSWFKDQEMRKKFNSLMKQSNVAAAGGCKRKFGSTVDVANNNLGNDKTPRLHAGSLQGCSKM